MTVSTLQPTSLTGNLIGISTLITNTLTADMINTTQLVVSTISLNSFLTNQAVYGPTVKKTSMVPLRTITINSTINTNDINAQLDNPPSIPQVYTFGPTIPNRWVVVGQDLTNPIVYSNNGIQWNNGSVLNSPSLTTNSIFYVGRGVAWSGSRWVAVGLGSNSIATSTDGINWTVVNNIFNGNGTSVSWNGLMWIATGIGSPYIVYSYDGLYWISSSVSLLAGYGVAFNYRRPYTLTFPTNSTTATISSISPSYTFPITIAQNNQLDICSDSYYNSGYTNFTMTIRGQFS